MYVVELDRLLLAIVQTWLSLGKLITQRALISRTFITGVGHHLRHPALRSHICPSQVEL